MSELSVKTLRAALAADTAACIAAAETAYHTAVAETADALLAHQSCRVLLLAGPSSSGKTTTARLLSAALAARGHEARTISLDDFYRNGDDPAYPRTPSGAFDYESPDALWLADIRACFSAVMRGEPYLMPRYDFKTASRLLTAEPLLLSPGGILIVEGLHALNPCITSGLPSERLFRLFISLSTNLTGENGTRLISGRKLRFLRRLCRDSEYRGADAAKTYALWQGVLAGEDAYLYPYRDTADTHIDTFHPYEVGVLAPIAARLLAAEDLPTSDYLDTVRAAIADFAPIPQALVPPDSLLREFLPPIG